MPKLIFNALTDEDWERVKLGRFSEADARATEQIVGSGRNSMLAAFLGRGAGTPDVTRPGLSSTRPSTEDGRVTFSFQHRTVAKQGRPAGGPPAGRIYLERTARAKASPEELRAAGAKFDRRMSVGGSAGAYYVDAGRPLPAGHMPARATDIARRPPGWAPGAAARGQRYIEREGAVEEDDGGARLSLGNIADEAEARVAFWEAVERRERADGRVQSRVIAELPYEREVGAEGRRRIVRTFAQALEDLGLKWHAAVHAPDPHSDQRNFHLHLYYHDRPAERRPDGSWWFSAWKASETREPGFVKSLRRRFADAVNAELERAGVHRRFDPRRYDELGLAKVPTAHLGVAAAGLERRGVVTVKGMRNVGREAGFRLWEIAAAASREVLRDAVTVGRLRDAADGLREERHPAARAAREAAVRAAARLAEAAEARVGGEGEAGLAGVRAADLVRRPRLIAAQTSWGELAKEAARVAAAVEAHGRALKEEALERVVAIRAAHRDARRAAASAVRSAEAERLLAERAAVVYRLDAVERAVRDGRADTAAWARAGKAIEDEVADSRTAAGRAAGHLVEDLARRGLVEDAAEALRMVRDRRRRGEVRHLVEVAGDDATSELLERFRAAERRLVRAEAARGRRRRIESAPGRMSRHVMSGEEERAYDKVVAALVRQLDAIDRRIVAVPAALAIAERRGLKESLGRAAAARRRQRPQERGRG